MLIQSPSVSMYSDAGIRSAFNKFVARDTEYRNRYLQSNFEHAFDGYSFLGQEDSLNQYSTDMLHSFVLSDFHEVEDFPVEFHSFLLEEWPEIKRSVRTGELEMIQLMRNDNMIDNDFYSFLNSLYEDDSIGYMMSCNYYPQPKSIDFVAENNTRLSAHKDVSLISSFPYGLEAGFAFLKGDEFSELGYANHLVQFSGYFMEYASAGKIQALPHRVELPQTLNDERFSFALFSMPKPECSFTFDSTTFTSEEYYEAYLSLF